MPISPMPDNTSNNTNDDDDDWDKLLDPYEDAMEAGREKGQQAGEKIAYNEGLAVGRTTGTEYGMELGFYQGAIESILDENDDNVLHPKLNERSRKTIATLQTMIDNFPTPEQIFAINNDDDDLLEQEEKEFGRDDNIADHDSEVANLIKGDLSVASRIQHIRARFKLLTVQLGIPNFSLATEMKKNAESSLSLLNGDGSGATPPVAPALSEW